MGWGQPVEGTSVRQMTEIGYYYPMTLEVHPEGDVPSWNPAPPDLAAMRARRQQQVAKTRRWRGTSTLTDVKAVERLDAKAATSWTDGREDLAPTAHQVTSLEQATQPDLVYLGVPSAAPESADTPLHHTDVSALFDAPRPGPLAGQTPALAV